MKLYLVRHSATLFEKETPSEEWVLSDTGVERAEALAIDPLLSDIDIVYTSSQLKALATGLKIAELLRKPMRVDHDLTEVTSVTKGFVPDYEATMARLYAGEIDRINDGETLDEALKRFNSSVNGIVERHAELGQIAIVSHCNVLSLFSAQYDRRSAHELHGVMQMPDLAILDWETKQFDMPFGTVEYS